MSTLELAGLSSNTPTIELQFGGSLPNASLEVVGTMFRGPKGDKGDPGPPSDAHHNHTQSLPSASWTITHNLGKFPAVSITDSSGSEVEGEIRYIDSNTVVISFAGQFSGKAYLN